MTKPKETQTLTTYLVVNDGKKALDFYKDAFGAEELYRNELPDGKIMHSQFMIGNSMIMLSDEFPNHGCLAKSPASLKGTTSMININVDQIDEAFEKAKKAGAKVVMPLDDMFWGDRYGQLEDPFGHVWSLSKKIKEMTYDEINAAAEACFKS